MFIEVVENQDDTENEDYVGLILDESDKPKTRPSLSLWLA
jgi:hypothetical protein